MTSTQTSATRRPLPGSLFFIFTGQGNNGKTEQMMRLMSSRWPDGTPAIAPFLLIVCETSTEGTAGPLIEDESMCLVWPVADFDEAKEAIAVVFPEGRPPLTLREARSQQHAQAVERAKAARRPPPLARPQTDADNLPICGVADALRQAAEDARDAREAARETEAAYA